jgi:hypothetical protein
MPGAAWLHSSDIFIASEFFTLLAVNLLKLYMAIFDHGSTHKNR